MNNLVVETTILVVPRNIVQGFAQFVPWDIVGATLEEFEVEAQWIPRTLAEQADDVVQLIPSAMVRDSRGKYLVLRRVRSRRPDLSRKLSLVAGGHINRLDLTESGKGLDQLFRDSLRRELQEELDVLEWPEPVPIGLVIDCSSLVSSRHIGVIYEIISSLAVDVRAREEFSQKPLKAGRFLSPDEITLLRDRLDPWSTILLTEYLRV